MNPRLTIVSTWYGPDTAGGAEVAARRLAHSIHALGHPVEVWSTTARDLFAPRDTHYPLGVSDDEGVSVRRFALSPALADSTVPQAVARHPQAMRTLKQLQLPRRELRVLSTLVHSDDLLDALVAEAPQRRYVFVPYPLPISVWGVMLVPQESYVLPCMHDEPYAYHHMSRWQMQHAQKLLANSAAERDFLLQQFALEPNRVVLSRLGIDLTVKGDGAAFRRDFGITTPMLFFAGRRDVTKNVPLLIRYVQEYILRRGRLVTLVLSGRDPIELTSYQQVFVRDVGFLSEQEKANAFAAADVFIHAGTQESFAFVLMEAWLQSRPALVNRACAVTAGAVAEARGGLDFADFASFAAAVDILLEHPEIASAFGASGNAYVHEHCRWPDVARRVVDAVLHD
jgi:glycosyltransferase involved in cell wall biosynthesis